MCVCVHIDVCTCVSMYVEARGQQMFSLIVLYIIVWDWASHQAHSTSVQLAETSTGLQGFTCFLLPMLQIHTCSVPGFYVNAGDSNSGPHASATNTLPTEPSL